MNPENQSREAADLTAPGAGQPPLGPEESRAFLLEMFQHALAAVDPMQVVRRHLPEPPAPGARTIVLGAGKAAARMALAVEAAWPGPLEGLVVTRYGHGAPTQRVEVVEARHPVPDQAGLQAAERMLALAGTARAGDLVICLVSGGGSALLTLPAAGITLEEKQTLTRALLHSGAPIGEINCVRRHLSAIKGGRLGRACGAARVVTLVVSDVPGDDPATVASGPTIESDTRTAHDALAILERYRLPLPPHIRQRLLTAPGGDVPATALGPRSVHTVASAQCALDAGATFARARGIAPLVLGGSLEGEARDVAAVHAGISRQVLLHAQPLAAPCIIISGGETTVTVRGDGRGGRNAEFLLALALAGRDLPGLHAIACDTDGIDGVEDNAGAVIGPDSLRRAEALGLDPHALLQRNDAYAFFEGLGDLVVTGPTRTNVNDFRAILLG